MPVFLIGYMGSGKTTLGRALSERLNWHFLDLDSLIEHKMGMSTIDAFELHGEQHFRSIEKQVLRQYQFDANMIIATGGGTPCFHDNMDYMNKIGYTMYLKVTSREILSRLELNTKRPLILDNKLNLKEFVTQQMFHRESYYLKSIAKIESDNISVDDLLPMINQPHE